MRPFQINATQWINLEHVTDWAVEGGTVFLSMVNSPQVDGHNFQFDGADAERFIKLMDLLAKGNFL